MHPETRTLSWCQLMITTFGVSDYNLASRQPSNFSVSLHWKRSRSQHCLPRQHGRLPSWQPAAPPWWHLSLNVSISLFHIPSSFAHIDRETLLFHYCFPVLGAPNPLTDPPIEQYREGYLNGKIRVLFQYKDHLSRYMDSHYKDETVLRPSHL